MTHKIGALVIGNYVNEIFEIKYFNFSRLCIIIEHVHELLLEQHCQGNCLIINILSAVQLWLLLMIYFCFNIIENGTSLFILLLVEE